MALWITFVVIGTVSCAVNSLILAEYVLRPFFDCAIPKSAMQLVALLALLTLCFINCYRVTWSTKLSIVFTTCKVAALLLIVGFGCYYLARDLEVNTHTSLKPFGPFLAFMALWITFVVIGTVSCAVNSLILAEYVLRPFFDCAIPKSAMQLVALLALLTLCFINCYRVTWSTKLSIVFTTCKVAALLLIVGFGCYYLARGNVNSFADPFEDSAINPGALANAFYQGFWAFAGWNYLNFLTGEMKNPARYVYSNSQVVIGLLVCRKGFFILITTHYLPIIYL
ncbi:hypothetical protein AHF37_05659 [Paragonimus kellicotti]|nr:hypothetical protein AHF37_05659 [Paragonimus kellicotti]